MRVSELYGSSPLAGADVFIVGTGPSLRVFPIDFLRGRCCVLLNTAHRILPGIGPVAFANHRDFVEGKPPLHPACDCPIQVVKGRLKYAKRPERTDNHVSWSDPKYYVFSYREPTISPAKKNGIADDVATGDEWSHFDEEALFNPSDPDFYWNVRKGTVAIFAVQFALLCGAKSVSLVGCDCCELIGRDADGEEKLLPCASQSNIGPPSMVHHYDQYAAGLDRLAKEARIRFGVPLLHLSPFPGFTREGSQFRAYQSWADNRWR